MKFFNIRFFRRSWTKISFGYNQIYRKKKLGISMTWTRFHTLEHREQQEGRDLPYTVVTETDL